MAVDKDKLLMKLGIIREMSQCDGVKFLSEIVEELILDHQKEQFGFRAEETKETKQNAAKRPRKNKTL
jgi:hypothetical protein